MSDNFFVLRADEDGDIRIDQFSKEQLEARLNEKYWGDAEIFSEVPRGFGESVTGLVIIKGHVHPPRKVETVTRFEL